MGKQENGVTYTTPGQAQLIVARNACSFKLFEALTREKWDGLRVLRVIIDLSSYSDGGELRV
jgi:hypothetical protein